MRSQRRLRDLVDHTVRLAGSSSRSEATDVALRALRELLGPRSDVVLTGIDPDAGTYEVLGGTIQGTSGASGPLGEHPVLGRLDPERSIDVGSDDPRFHADLRARLRAAGVRTLIHRPLRAPEGSLIGAVLVLRRSRRPRTLPDEVDSIFDHLAAVLHRLRIADALGLALSHRDEATAAIVSLTREFRAVDGSQTPDEAVGHALRTLRGLDPELVGIVIGVVSDGVVTRVSAAGTTPRSFVESLHGTRLDGFPIGRQIMSTPDPIFTGPEKVSLATRTRVMEPLGAHSLLAAGGREAGTVRLVVSCYRESPDPPPDHVLAAISCALDAGAAVLGRLDRDALIEATSASVGQGLVVCDRSGRIVSANEPAKALAPDLPSSEDWDADYSTLDGHELDAEDRPGVRARSGERIADLLLLHRATERVHRIGARPLPSGGALLTISDATEEVDLEEGGPEPVPDLSERRARKTR